MLNREESARANVAPRSGPAAQVVVVSEGPGADHLRSVLAREPRLPLVVLDYARHDVYPDALGTADVLIAILGTEPGQYSVPSKILTYHCAGRPILGVLPEENPAAATIRAAGSGAVVPLDDRDAIGRALDELRADPSTARAMGARAREYAEKHFAIGPIADRFERLIQVDPQR